MEANADFWKKKYEESEEKFQTLKELAHKGVADYEELKKKYDQNYKQYEELKVQLEEAQEKLRSFDYYASEAVQQFDELEKKCELQENLVQEVSSYASKVTQDKKKFQRESKALLDMFGSQLTIDQLKDITEIEENNGDVTSGNGPSTDQKLLLAKIEELTSTQASLETRLQHSDTDRTEALESIQIIASKLEIEKQKVHRLELCVKEHQRSLQKFQRVSMMAIQEHEELETKLLIEKELKETAVKEAQKIESERKAVVRQSSAAILEASADEKLRTAFMNIEELSRKLTDTEIRLQDKEEEIKDLTNNSENLHSITMLEEKLSVATDEIGKFEAKIKEYTIWNEKLTRDYEKLEQQLREKEAQLVPPPPPPPPPPPIILRPLLKLVGKKRKKHLPAAAKDKPPEFHQALEELMAKIRSGNVTGSLRGAGSRSRQGLPISRHQSQENASLDESSGATLQDGDSAMHQMKGMLKKMSLRRSQSESTVPEEKPENEFLSAFKRVRGNQSSSRIEESGQEVFEV